MGLDLFIVFGDVGEIGFAGSIGEFSRWASSCVGEFGKVHT